MTRKILESCPSCGGALEITEVHCTRCDTQVRAHYRPCDFCSLSEEQSTFLRIFVETRGNLTEVEKRLGVSYPTVRAKLDEVIGQLGSPQPIAPPPSRVTLDAAGAEAARSGVEAARHATAHPAPAPAQPPRAGTAPGHGTPEPASERRAILDAVARGELSATEGLERIRMLGGTA